MRRLRKPFESTKHEASKSFSSKMINHLDLEYDSVTRFVVTRLKSNAACLPRPVQEKVGKCAI